MKATVSLEISYPGALNAVQNPLDFTEEEP